jgi:DNA polymerase I
VLQELAADYELPRLILEHRSLAKLKSTYTDRLPEKIHPTPAGCIPITTRPWPRPAGCPRPIPTCRTSRSARPKVGASARPSSLRTRHRLLAADYSQIELRIMAHLSDDERLLEAFAAGEDIHKATAAEVFGLRARPGRGGAASGGQGDQLRPDVRHEQPGAWPASSKSAQGGR